MLRRSTAPKRRSRPPKPGWRSPRANTIAASNCGIRATVSERDLDQRLNGQREAEANLRAAQAALQSAKLNLDYTEVRAPVAGRVGQLEVTVGNLVPAGPGAQMLTTLVSVDPIYASFSADEDVVMRALQSLGANAIAQIDKIPVKMSTASSNGTVFDGRLQLIDNQVDARSGTVRVRAVFANADGRLMPGQFARVRMGQAKTEPALMVNERAIGTDQNKRFVLVVGEDNKAEYREVTVGALRRRPAHRHHGPQPRRTHHRQRAATRPPRRRGCARTRRHERAAGDGNRQPLRFFAASISGEVTS